MVCRVELEGFLFHCFHVLLYHSLDILESDLLPAGCW
jgi:hypothetical protein